MIPPWNCRFLTFLLHLSVRGISTKSIAEHGPLEVQVRVQVFDSSDLSPLANAFIEVHGNQSVLASGESGNDGALAVSFLYRPGTLVIIAAAKRDYITKSETWHASRIPLYTSVSLYLLAERPGTLILYDDIIQVFRGSPGMRNQPRLKLLRRSVPLNTSFADVSASLTTTMAQEELASFPYLLALEPNATAKESSWVELTAVVAVSAQLSDRDGQPIPVSEPFDVFVPLPSDTRVRSPTKIPVWLYHSKTGVWVRNGTSYIKREGTQLTWEFRASQLGYWMAAFPSSPGSIFGHMGLWDITAYHQLFLFAILASLALLVLVLLCVLLYYCRRRCLKPRRQQGKAQNAATLNSARRDQGTSMSRLNLICGGGHAEAGASGSNQDTTRSDASPSRDYKSARDDFSKHVPTHKLRHSKSKGSKGAQKGESFPMKVHRATETVSMEPSHHRDEYGHATFNQAEEKDGEYHRRNVAKDNRGYTSDPPSPPPDKPPEYSQVSHAGDPLARPTSLNTQPGQIIFCSSLDQMKENIYRSMVPTLVIPAHYMRLSSEFGAGEGGKDGQALSDKEGLGGAAGGNHQGPQGQSSQQQAQQGGSSPDDSESSSWASGAPAGSVHIPVLFNDSTMAQMNGELQALTEKKLLELGVKQHPRAWFISLDGRANAHVRHSYIDVSADLSHAMVHTSSHSTPTTLSTSTHNTQPCSSSSKDCSPDTISQDSQDRKHHSSSSSSTAQRRGKENGRDERSASGRKAHGGSGSGAKPYSKLAYQDALELSGGVARMGASSPLENPLTPLLDEGPEEPRGSPLARKGRSRGNSSRSSNSESRRDSVTSPEEDPDDKDENKKSPWQRHEERPLMVFHAKK